MRSLDKFTHLLLLTFVLVLTATGASAQFRKGGSVVFDDGNSALHIPFELNSDKIYLQVSIDGGGPFWLVLDTGSPGMILDTRVGEALGITTGEGFHVGGAGENPFTLARADSTFDVELPGLRMLGQQAHVGNIDAIVGPFEGRRIDGVLGGYNIFSGYIVEIDYYRQQLNIRDRQVYEYPGDGTVVPIEIDEGHCVIAATAILADGDTLTGEFMLDTGLRGTLVFNTPYVNEQNLLDRIEPTLYTTTGGGVGGQVKTHIGRLGNFVFGGVSFGGIYASLSQIESGALGNPDRAGIIGAAVLQHFRVIFDYAGERLILFESEYEPGRLDFDKSGTFLVADVGDRSIYCVIDVIPGSPAVKAGLAVGDIIRTIDGKPANEISLEQARRFFRRESGTTYSIEYERDGALHSTSLTLKKVI
jgi:hypothetical protein